MSVRGQPQARSAHHHERTAPSARRETAGKEKKTTVGTRGRGRLGRQKDKSTHKQRGAKRRYKPRIAISAVGNGPQRKHHAGSTLQKRRSSTNRHEPKRT